MNDKLTIQKLKKELTERNLKAFCAINSISLAKEASDRARNELMDKLVNDRKRIYRITGSVRKALIRYEEAFTDDMRQRALDILKSTVTVEELLLQELVKEEAQDE